MTTQVPRNPRGGRALPGRPWQHAAEEMVEGKYRLVRPLGYGGMAEVWLATHIHLKTEVAVKFLSAGLVGDPGQARIMLQRFQFEAQISARLGSRTRHIVAVQDAGMHDDMPYLVMEYVPGRTLSEELRAKGPMNPVRLALVLEQMADALSIAHDMGIVHRDIKPSNVLLFGETNEELTVKIADFGIAKALHNGLRLDRPNETDSALLLGSPSYMSPEQIRSPSNLSQLSDIWSVGVLIYEMLVDESPFLGDSMGEVMIAVSTERFELPTKLRPTLPPSLDEWCLRALAKNPNQRFASVAEMARSFRLAVTTTKTESTTAVVRQLSQPGRLKTTMGAELLKTTVGAGRRKTAKGAAMVVLFAALGALPVIVGKVREAPRPVPAARLLSPLVLAICPTVEVEPSVLPSVPIEPGLPIQANPPLQPSITPFSEESSATEMLSPTAARSRAQVRGPNRTSAPSARPVMRAAPAREPSRRKEIDKSEIL